MKQVVGVVSRIFSQDLPTPDQFGNVCRVSFKVEGDENYYGCGGKKYPKLSIKQGKGFVDIEAGDNIAFFASERTYNNKVYYDVKSSQITLVAKGNGAVSNTSGAQPAAARQPQAARPAPVQQAGGGKSFTATELSIRSGRAVNGAISLFTSGHASGLTDALKMVIALEKFSDENYVSLYENAQATPQVKTAASPEQVNEALHQAAQQQADDDFDDDIPF